METQHQHVMLALQENMKILMHTKGLHAKHVELVNIMIRQVRRPAKHVWLERIKIKLGRVIAKVVELVNIMIRQVRHPAKHVRLEHIKIKPSRMLAYRAQQVDTPTKSQQQQKTNANIAGKENLQHNPQALQSFIFLSPLATVQMPTLSQRH